MKKILLAVICCLTLTAVHAENMKFKIKFNQIDKVRGELADFAGPFLGTKDVIGGDEHYYELQKVNISQSSTIQSTSTTRKTEPEKRSTVIAKQLPLSEEALMATDIKQKAELVARQIYTIREIRTNLLCGDVEHAPADGKAMELVLKELNKEERELTGMFVGKTVITPHTKTVVVNIPDSALSYTTPIASFSPKHGAMPVKSGEGTPILLTVQRHQRTVLAAEQPKKKGADPIYTHEIYRITTIITYQDEILYEKTTNL